MGRSNALFASTHPCYIGGGYECSCGHRSRTSEEHRNHVYGSHDKEYAKKVLPWIDYIKQYEPESYQKLLSERKQKRLFKQYMKKKGYVYHRFFGWYNKNTEKYLEESELLKIKQLFV